MDQIKEVFMHYLHQIINLITDHGIISAIFGIGLVFCIIYTILESD